MALPAPYSANTKMEHALGDFLEKTRLLGTKHSANGRITRPHGSSQPALAHTIFHQDDNFYHLRPYNRWRIMVRRSQHDLAVRSYRYI